MEQTKFLVGEMNGGLVIFPGDTDREIAFAKKMCTRIIKNCNTREEASQLVADMTGKAVAKAMGN